MKLTLRGWSPALFVMLIVQWICGCSRDNHPSLPPPAPPTNPSGYSTITMSGTTTSRSEENENSEHIISINGTTLSKRQYDYLWQIFKDNRADSEDTQQALRESFHRQLMTEQLLIHEARLRGIDQHDRYKAQQLLHERELLLQLLKDELARQIRITEDDIERYYQTHQDSFAVPERVQVRHILTNTRENADEVLFQLQQGADFGEIAQEYSVHPSGAAGGSLPPFTRETYSDQFEDAAFSLDVGEVSGIIQTDLGFHIIEKTASQPRRIKPLDEVRDNIVSILKQNKYDRTIDNLIESLRRRFEIETHFEDVQP